MCAKPNPRASEKKDEELPQPHNTRLYITAAAPAATNNGGRNSSWFARHGFSFSGSLLGAQPANSTSNDNNNDNNNSNDAPAMRPLPPLPTGPAEAPPLASSSMIEHSYDNRSYSRGSRASRESIDSYNRDVYMAMRQAAARKQTPSKNTEPTPATKPKPAPKLAPKFTPSLMPLPPIPPTAVPLGRISAETSNQHFSVAVQANITEPVQEARRDSPEASNRDVVTFSEAAHCFDSSIMQQASNKKKRDANDFSNFQNFRQELPAANRERHTCKDAGQQPTLARDCTERSDVREETTFRDVRDDNECFYAPECNECFDECEPTSDCREQTQVMQDDRDCRDFSDVRDAMPSTATLAAEPKMCTCAENCDEKAFSILSKFCKMMQESPCEDVPQLMSRELNKVYIGRLEEIDKQAEGNSELKLITYQEWVSMLLHLNETALGNMTELEAEVQERLSVLQMHMSAEKCAQSNEVEKYRQDITQLIKLIQNGYYNDNWDLECLCFETLTPQQILCRGERTKSVNNNSFDCAALQPANCDEQLKNKLLMNMKALTIEVAQKHDEICQLKSQINCMEDEIQKAQQKIQLKDDVIKELRQDLRCNNSASSERLDAFRKLDTLRRELVQLDSNSNCSPMCQQRNSTSAPTSGASTARDGCTTASSTGNDSCDDGQQLELITIADIDQQDDKIIQTLRSRLCGQNVCIFDLRKRVHDLEVEKCQLTTTFQTAQSISNTNKRVLKEIAAVISDHSCVPLDYCRIYDKQNCNPFVDVIQDLLCKYDEKEKNLLRQIQCRNDKILRLENSIKFFQKELNCREAAANEKHKNEVDCLKAELQALRNTVCERDKNIANLKAELDELQASALDQMLPLADQRLCDMEVELESAKQENVKLKLDLEETKKNERFYQKETCKLSDELYDLRRLNSDLKLEAQRASCQLNLQKDSLLDANRKLQEAECKIQEQCRTAHKMNMQFCQLEQAYKTLEKRCEELEQERAHLHNELYVLKERNAESVGKQKGVHEQLQRLEMELCAVNRDNQELQCTMARNANAHKMATGVMKETLTSVQRQYNEILGDLQQLQCDYDKKVKLVVQHERVIDSFRKWKEAQMAADETNRCCLERYETQIRFMVEEKEKLLTDFQSLFRDYSIMEREFDRMKRCSCSCSCSSRNASNGSASANNVPLYDRMQMLRNTSRRLSEQSRVLLADVESHNNQQYPRQSPADRCD